ncbi:MAG: hypothetical protein VYA30_16230 [Myxococcota bacterium]|nr:hypothetical protein [Myxococcota bacterium]
MRKSYGVILLLCLNGVANAHIGPKKVLRIGFNPQLDERPEVVIQNFGLFNWDGNEFKWLCDEAMTPVGGLNAVTLVSRDGRKMLVGDGAGLYSSGDSGCNFQPYGPPFSEHNIGQIEASRENPSDVLVSTQTLGVPNEVFHSLDGGASWRSLNLIIEGRVRRLLRSQSNPAYIYLVHAGGGYRSVDGGYSFDGFPMGPPESNATGVDFDLLKIHPENPNIVYAVISGFPTSTLVQTTDAGASWRELSVLDDIPESIAVMDSEHLILAMPVGGLKSSTDGGITWAPIESPLTEGWLGCLTKGRMGKLWACVNRHPTRLLVSSTDQGMTWQDEINLSLANVKMSTRCPLGSQTQSSCSENCDDYPMTCESDSTDAGVRLPDAQDEDAGQPVRNAETTRKTDGGCSVYSPDTVHKSSPSHWIMTLCVLTLASASRRRKIQSQETK